MDLGLAGMSGAGQSQDELPADSGQTPNSSQWASAQLRAFEGHIPTALGFQWEQSSCDSTPEQFPVLSPLSALTHLNYVSLRRF